MYKIYADTLQDSFYHILRTIKDEGKDVEVRGQKTRECHPCLMQIKHPQKRTLLYPKRGNNPFSTLAETLWVLAGRNDMKFLTEFLPRATDYSDDGKVWRAGYGPRIREWEELRFDEEKGIKNLYVDQIEFVVKQLIKDPASRQAVMSIWDPVAECNVTQTKDFPCCNWIHFMIRDGALDCTVTMRSNDAVWGYSSINVYEWTVLQEILANFLGVGVGSYYHLSDSLHVYEKHYEKMDEMIKSYIGLPELPTFRFNRKLVLAEHPLHTLNIYFEEIEEVCQRLLVAGGEDSKIVNECLRESYELLSAYLNMQKLKQEDRHHEQHANWEHTLSKLKFSDLVVACDYWFQKNIIKLKDDGGDKLILGSVIRCESHTKP